MSNRTYICLRCRKSVRAKAAYGANTTLKCSSCQLSLFELPWEWRIPKKNDEKEWQRLANLVAKWSEERNVKKAQIRASLLNENARKMTHVLKMKDGTIKESKLKRLAEERKKINDLYPENEAQHNLALE